VGIRSVYPAELRALTLCIKLSMSLIYQFIPITTGAVANNLPERPKVRKTLDDDAPVSPTHCVGCGDEAFGEKLPGPRANGCTHSEGFT
jgi:hypothetical protein